MQDTVIVRYGEIFLKSEYVKKQFENRLVENIQDALKKEGIEAKTNKKRHRIYLKTKQAQEAAERLQKVFGIVTASPAEKTTSNMDDMIKKGLELAEKTIQEKESFAVRVKRTGKHAYSSMEVERTVAGRILQNIDARVDLTNPKKTIHLEITDDEAYVFDTKYPGPGGLPYKTQGKVVSLISTGIDSPVAAWMMMHRGCETIALHFETGGDIEPILEALEEYTPKGIKRYVVPYREIQQKIAEHAGKHTCIVCKRAMLKIARNIMEKEKACGIVTGDNLGQVASQTLSNLEILDEAAEHIYRPLIGMDKDEIIQRARKIGTYQHADKKKCVYAPKHPATTAKIKEIRYIEEKIGVDEIIGKLKCLKK